MPDVLFIPALVAYLSILVALFAYGVNFVYMTVLAIRTGPAGPRRVSRTSGRT